MCLVRCLHSRPQRRKKELWSPADDMWVHDKFAMLSLPPEQDPDLPQVCGVWGCAFRKGWLSWKAAPCSTDALAQAVCWLCN